MKKGLRHKWFPVYFAKFLTEVVMQWISHDLLHLNILLTLLCLFLTSTSFPFTSRRPLWLRKYEGFDFSRDHTIEVPRNFLGGVLSSWCGLYQILRAVGLVNVEMKRFDLTRDHMVDVTL